MKTVIAIAVATAVGATALFPRPIPVAETSPAWVLVNHSTGTVAPFDEAPPLGWDTEHACHDRAIAEGETTGHIVRCLPACQYDDETGCVWIESRTGNRN